MSMDKIMLPWEPTGEEAINLNRELLREVGSGHLLCGRSMTAIAKRVDCDDVLFRADHDSSFYAVVHLTWRGETEDDPKWPAAEIYGSFAEWLERRMQLDHDGYYAN